MHYVELMCPIIKKAGDLAMSHFRGTFDISLKKNGSIVTSVDLACEEILKNELCVALPGSGCIAEESTVAIKAGHEGFVWVIDPIDGTKNFARGIPCFCITVALMQGSQLIAAVTYSPTTQDWFYAQKDFGAFMTQAQNFPGSKPSEMAQAQSGLSLPRRLTASSALYPKNGALVIVSSARLKDAQFLEKIKEAFKVAGTDVSFRVCGAAALDLAYIAAGFYEAVIFQDLHWWDAAAGVILVEQAGGMVCQHDGGKVSVQSRTLLAGNPDACKLILSILVKSD